MLRRSKSLKKERSQRIMTPAEKKYKEDFNEYLELKEKKDEFLEYKKKTENDDWDNYTKGIDSPNKKGFQLKSQLSSQQPQIYEFESVKPKIEHEEVLNSFNDRDKEAFIRLRDLYNSLDPVKCFIIVEWKGYSEYNEIVN